jgi:hypothetical protein
MFLWKSKDQTGGGLALNLFINKWRSRNEHKIGSIANHPEKKSQSRWLLFIKILRPFWLR